MKRADCYLSKTYLDCPIRQPEPEIFGKKFALLTKSERIYGSTQYFDSFGNLWPPKELERYLANNVIEYNRMPHQRYSQNNCSFVYSFYERLTSNFRTNIALFNFKCLFETCRWCLRWPTREASSPWATFGRYGWWRLRARSDGL